MDAVGLTPEHDLQYENASVQDIENTEEAKIFAATGSSRTGKVQRSRKKSAMLEQLESGKSVWKSVERKLSLKQLEVSSCDYDSEMRAVEEKVSEEIASKAELAQEAFDRVLEREKECILQSFQSSRMRVESKAKEEEERTRRAIEEKLQQDDLEFERKLGRIEAVREMETERLRRMSCTQLENDMEEYDREKNQAVADIASDSEQNRQVAEITADATIEQADRNADGEEANFLMQKEQERRVLINSLNTEFIKEQEQVKQELCLQREGEDREGRPKLDSRRELISGTATGEGAKHDTPVFMAGDPHSLSMMQSFYEEKVRRESDEHMDKWLEAKERRHSLRDVKVAVDNEKREYESAALLERKIEDMGHMHNAVVSDILSEVSLQERILDETAAMAGEKMLKEFNAQRVDFLVEKELERRFLEEDTQARLAQIERQESAALSCTESFIEKCRRVSLQNMENEKLDLIRHEDQVIVDKASENERVKREREGAKLMKCSDNTVVAVDAMGKAQQVDDVSCMSELARVQQESIGAIHEQIRALSHDSTDEGAAMTP